MLNIIRCFRAQTPFAKERGLVLCGRLARKQSWQFRRNKRNRRFDWFAFVLAFLVALGFLCNAEDKTPATSVATPNVFSMITNPPPITEITMRFQSGQEKPKLCRFRAQDNAFLARVTEEHSFTDEFHVKDTQCGFWETDYWDYEYVPPPVHGAPPRPPVVFRYHYSNTDLSSKAYDSVQEYLGRLRLFTSLGIALGKGLNPVTLNEAGEFVYKEAGFTVRSAFEMSNSLPTRARLTILDPMGNQHTSHVTYTYSPDILAGRIPSFIKQDAGYSIEVLSLAFGERGRRLPQKDFAMPEALRNAADLQQIVHSNHSDYEQVAGKLVGMSADAADRRLRDGIAIGAPVPNSQRRPYVIVAILAISVLVLTLLTRRMVRG
jgi:hypothetical protein